MSNRKKLRKPAEKLTKEIMCLFEANPFLIETAEGIALRIGRNVDEVEPVLSSICSDAGIDMGDIKSWVVKEKEEDPIASNGVDEDMFGFPELFEEILTSRENEVMVLLLQGCTYPEIADELTISVHTVKNHVNSVYQKLHVTSRAELFSKVISLFLRKKL